MLADYNMSCDDVCISILINTSLIIYSLAGASSLISDHLYILSASSNAVKC